MRPVIIGHRGSPVTEVENTLSSFERAVSEGAEWIECDVRTSADGRLVVFHDDDLVRMAGLTSAVRELTLAELGQVHLHGGGSIPTLEDVLSLGHPTVVDVKDAEPEVLLGSIRSASAEHRVLISSFEPALLSRINEISDIPTALLLRPGTVFSRMDGVDSEVAAVFDMSSGAYLPFESLPLKRGCTLNIYHLIMLVPEEPGTAERIVEHCHSLGVQVNVWTINDPDDMLRCLDLGVDGVITDTPGPIRKIRDAGTNIR